MDVQTIHAYNSTAAARCERYRLILPTELLLYAPDFFHPGQPTADIGCGSGRDVAWLNEHGFPSIGYDASPAMLAEARTAYPGIDVRAAALPKLGGVPDGAYANVLCSVVLMHLPRKDLGRAVRSLVSSSPAVACCSPTAPVRRRPSVRGTGGYSQRSRPASLRCTWMRPVCGCRRSANSPTPTGPACAGSYSSPRNSHSWVQHREDAVYSAPSRY